MLRAHGSNSSAQRGIRFRDLVLFYVVVVFSVRWIAFRRDRRPKHFDRLDGAYLLFSFPLPPALWNFFALSRRGGILWTREAFGGMLSSAR